MAAAAFSANAQSSDEVAPTHWRFGVQFGAAQDHGRSEPTGQISLGYDLDRTWSVEALANVSLLFVREGESLQLGEREFDDAVGARVLARLPLGDRWSLVGGLGVVQVENDIGNGDLLGYNHEYKTSALVSASAMYRLGRRWSIGVETAAYPAAHTVNTALRAEFHF